MRTNPFNVDKSPIEDSVTYHDLLVRVRSSPSRQWITEYLDLAKEIVQTYGIAAEDPRLVMSMPRAGALPIIVNQRYVLRGPHEGKVGFIMPCEYVPGPTEKVVDDYFFDRMHARQALWVEFPIRARIDLDERSKTLWKTAVERELARGRRSSYRRFHQPIVFAAVVNDEYRKLLLDRAFPQHNVYTGPDRSSVPCRIDQ